MESPQTDVAGTSSASKISSVREPGQPQVESDDTLTTDTSSSEAAAIKNKRHRPKVRSESSRSEKYAKIQFLVSCFFPVQLGVSILWFSSIISIYKVMSLNVHLSCLIRFYPSVYEPIPCVCKYIDQNWITRLCRDSTIRMLSL